MEDLLSLARRPPITVTPNATVRELAAVLVKHKVGAALVLDAEGALVGIVSERDIVSRVVAPSADPETTKVADIMTKDVRTARASETAESALQTMVVGHFRHLPIVDDAGKAVGTLSVRHLLKQEVGELSRRNADLMNYIEADGPGG
jgi:CBS domain-containing protein